MKKVVIVHHNPITQLKLRKMIVQASDHFVIENFQSVREAAPSTNGFGIYAALIELNDPHTHELSSLMRSLRENNKNVNVLFIKGKSFKVTADLDLLIRNFPVITEKEFNLEFLTGSVKQGAPKWSDSSLDSLTLLEKDILRYIARGKSTKDIADILCKSPKTIENKRLQISKKLNLNGHNSLLIFALQHESEILTT